MNKSANAPKQSPTLGRFLKIVGVLVGLSVFIVGIIIYEEYNLKWQAGLFIAGISALSAQFFWNWGKRHLTPLADKVLESDHRPPIVYLRSFLNESVVSGAELAFANMFKKVGPFVAIGAPGEKLPPLGAARLYLEDNNWKSVVADLVNKARLVIIYGGITPGLGWEVQHVKTNMAPSRTVIMVPNGKDDYEAFRQMADQEAGLRLPGFPPKRLRKYASPGTVGFVTFDNNWKPKFVKMPKATRRSDGSILNGGGEGASVWAALATICNNVGIPVKRPPRDWLMSYFHLMVFLSIVGVIAVVAIILASEFNILQETGEGTRIVWPQSLDQLNFPDWWPDMPGSAPKSK